MAVPQTLCSDCQMQLNFFDINALCYTIPSLETCGAKTVLLQMFILGVKALLWKTATLATVNVERT
jgi:hypothetical protein